jgi:hypothetical protein
VTPTYIALLSLIVGFLLGFITRRVNSSQNDGELIVRNAIRKHFQSPNYHLLNHITLKHGSSTTQIDHILVSRYGVFVIETKNYKGWIFANAKQATWTQVLYRVKFKFQNPIHQNHLHVVAVRELLDFLPQDAIKSVVVFSGDAEFKTEMPNGVFKLSEMIGYVRGCTEELLSENRVQFAVGRIETARLAISSKTDVEHVDALKKRYGSKELR